MENLLNIGSITIVIIALVTYLKIQAGNNALKEVNNIHYKRDQRSYKKAV
jgi:hypothetical protein